MTTVAESPDFADPVAAAFWCADRGMPLFPVSGKVPLWPGWQERATTNAMDFTAWAMDPKLNLGIACGPAGLLVMDEDVPGAFTEFAASKGEAIPPTLTVSTGRGAHYYFSDGGHGLGNARGSLPAGIDVRGVGGYVVAPGSVHASGSRYLPVDPTTPVAEVPAWLVEVLTSTKPKASEHPWLDGRRPSGLAGLPEVIPVGQRRDLLFRFAASMRRRRYPFEDAWALMWMAFQRAEQVPAALLPWEEAAAQLVDVYRRYPDGGAADFDEEVERAARRMRVREAAQQIVTAERLAKVAVPDLDAGTLAEVLARPAEPPYRAERLLPWEASALVVAMRKRGKTSLLANLARSLLAGEPFLGRFAVRPVTGRVAVLNFEVPGAMLARWMDDLGPPADRLVLVNLRGRPNPLVAGPGRDALATYLRGQQVESLFVDPFGRAFTGTSQNDAGEVQAFLTNLDVFARSEVGARDLVLTAHAGWDGERTRGSTALEDWADTIVTLTKGKAEGDDARYLSAIGRDVEVEEDRLEFDPVTRRLTMTGSGSRSMVAQREQVEEALRAVLGLLAEESGQSQRSLERGVGARAAVVREAARLGIERGLLTTRVEGAARLHYLVRPAASERVPDVASDVRPRVPIGDADAPQDAADSPQDEPVRDAAICEAGGCEDFAIPITDVHGVTTTLCKSHRVDALKEDER